MLHVESYVQDARMHRTRKRNEYRKYLHVVIITRFLHTPPRRFHFFLCDGIVEDRNVDFRFDFQDLEELVIVAALIKTWKNTSNSCIVGETVAFFLS